jgi:hypothetical protein
MEVQKLMAGNLLEEGTTKRSRPRRVEAPAASSPSTCSSKTMRSVQQKPRDRTTLGTSVNAFVRRLCEWAEVNEADRRVDSGTGIAISRLPKLSSAGDLPPSSLPPSSLPPSSLPTSSLPTSSLPTSSLPTSSLPRSISPPPTLQVSTAQLLPITLWHSWISPFSTVTRRRRPFLSHPMASRSSASQLPSYPNRSP